MDVQRIPNIGIGVPFQDGPYPQDDIICHRSWMTHRLLMPAQKLPAKLKEGEKRQWSRLEIMMDLTGEDFITRHFWKYDDVALTLDLRTPHTIIPNLSVVWNWSTKSARQFINELVKERLITADLAAAVLDRLPSNGRIERDQLPKRARESVWAKTSGLCVYCGTRLTTTPGKSNSFHADHVLSVKKGGSDDIANLIPSCATCNSKKGAKTVLEHLLGKAVQ